jgi:hypothetical protein
VIHEDVQGLIMQHLTGKDLLRMSEVSPAWKNVLSSRIAEKVRLNFAEESPDYENLKMLVESPREYKAMAVGSKNVTVVKYFAKRVEDLQVIQNWEGENKKYCDCQHYSIQNSLRDCKKLKILDLIAYHKWLRNDCTSVAEAVIDQIEVLKLSSTEDCLDHFPNLKTLLIEKLDNSNCPCDEEFPMDSVENLQLNVYRTNDPSYSSDACYHLEYFPNITSLHVSRLTVELMEFIAENKPNLKKLSYGIIDEGVKERYDEMRQNSGEDIGQGIEFTNKVMDSIMLNFF